MLALTLVGIGAGDPGLLSPRAIGALRDADLILVPLKGPEKADLADIRRKILADAAGDGRVVEFDLPHRADDACAYLDGVNDWHDAVAGAWREAIVRHLPGGGRVALMIWGDPSLYDSSLRIAGRLRAGGMDLSVTVVPGITSLQLLAAAHAIPLNRLGAPFLVTTGRRLAADGWPAGVDSVAVMLDGACAFQGLPPDDLTIWWGAYLGMPQQILRAGALAETGAEIVALRAAARARHGWIMDVYLLRRTSPR